MKAIRFIGRECARAALVGVLLLAGTAVASSIGGGAASILVGLVTGDRLTLTSTSGTALSAIGQGSAYAVAATGGTTNGSIGLRGACSATNCHGVYGTGQGTGTGVIAQQGNSSGFALEFQVTGTGRAPLRFPSLASEPTLAHSVGDAYMTPGGRLRVVQTAGTPGTFVGPLGDDFASIAAAGTTQATAAVCTTSLCKVSGASGTNGITLRSGTEAGCQMVSNIAGSALLVYGHNSDNDTIDGGAADASVTQAASAKSVWYCTSNGVAWTSFQ